MLQYRTKWLARRRHQAETGVRSMSEIWANQTTQSFQANLPAPSDDCRATEQPIIDFTPIVQSMPCSGQSGACIVASDFVDRLKSKYFELKNR